jgi:hypothetical protein
MAALSEGLCPECRQAIDPKTHRCGMGYKWDLKEGKIIAGPGDDLAAEIGRKPIYKPPVTEDLDPMSPRGLWQIIPPSEPVDIRINMDPMEIAQKVVEAHGEALNKWYGHHHHTYHDVSGNYPDSHT